MDARTDALSVEEFEQAMLVPAMAQISLVNAIRRSLAKDHIRPWALGGPTDLDNLILLCRFHHGLVHEGGWRLAVDPGTGSVSAVRPDGRLYEIGPSRPSVLATGPPGSQAA